MASFEDILDAAFELADLMLDPRWREMHGGDASIVIALEDEFMDEVCRRVAGTIGAESNRLLAVRTQGGFMVFKQQGFVPIPSGKDDTDE